MGLWYVFFIGTGFLFIFLFDLAGLTMWQGYLCTVGIEFLLYMAVSILRSARIGRILNEHCDPVRYLEKIKRQKERMKRKPKLIALLSVNEAAAYMLLGDYAAAKEIMTNISKEYLSDKNGSLLIYTINSILYHYELEEEEEANRLYETQLPLLILPGKRNKLWVQILIGERLYYLRRYDECYQHMTELLDIELTKRQYLGILYRLAQIDAIRGNYESAFKKYRKIARFGNLLWIAEEAGRILQEEVYKDYQLDMPAQEERLSGIAAEKRK